MKEYQVEFSELVIPRNEIYELMGYREQTPNDEVLKILEEQLAELASICKPKYGYAVYDVKVLSKTSLEVNGVVFNTGRVITGYITEASHVVLILATVGREFEAWLHRIKDGGDILRLFVADAIGSVLAEAVVSYVMKQLEANFSSEGFTVSNPYSPGYCGWHVREQKSLFSLFPKDICGVELTDSCLMMPIKSVSGLVGIGKSLEKKPYGCMICEMKTCYKKNLTKR